MIIMYCYTECEYVKNGVCIFNLSIFQQEENEKLGIPMHFCDGFYYLDVDEKHTNCGVINNGIIKVY